jgi:hypothetical protein
MPPQYKRNGGSITKSVLLAKPLRWDTVFLTEATVARKLKLLTTTRRDSLPSGRGISSDQPKEKHVQYDQPIGTTVGGFTVGHRATVSFTKAIGTIVGVGVSDGTTMVTLDFAEPQPVDIPEGARTKRFFLDFKSIKSTWYEPETVVFENVLEGQRFTVPEDGDDKVYVKRTPDENSPTSVFDLAGKELGSTGFEGITCKPIYSA